MKLFYFLLLLLPSTFMCANPNFPVLPAQAETVEAFAPSGWRVHSSTNGDINRDGSSDVVFVLESNSDMTFKEKDIEKVYKPRILGIAFKNSAEGNFSLKLQSNDFILTNEGNIMVEDPFESMMVKSGTIRFYFRYLNSLNKWYISDQTFIFRYNNNQFELVGFEQSSLHRASQQYVRDVQNYLTKVTTHTRRENDTVEEVARHEKFELAKIFTLTELGRPDSFDGVEIDFYENDGTSKREQQEESLTIKKSVKKARRINLDNDTNNNRNKKK